MSVRVNFEIGHEASIRTKATVEGFTHDWEVFVRGSGGNEIGHFIDKVIFNLHETFPKPKRVVKEPPFSVKESGYAGFVIPIEVYLKNKDEPKRIKFTYDLVLHQTGPDTYNQMNEQYVFHNPNEDFKKKLLKGGGFITNHSSYSGHDQERNSRDSFTDEKTQLISKPKLSGEAAKKHKPPKEHRYDAPRPSHNFVNLFGAPIHKPSKISPEPKKAAPPPPPPSKPERKEKEKSSSDKEKQKSKHEHKDKEKKKEEKDKPKEDKVRGHKDPEKVKEKTSKRPSERPPSPAPVPPKKKCPSPPRRPPSPPAKANGPIIREEIIKPPKDIEPVKKSTKEPPEVKSDKEKKSKKEKKSHDKDKERSSKKEHKKENHKWGKEPPKELAKPKELEVRKERDAPSEPPPPPPPPPPKEKLKPEKPFNKFSIENMLKKPEPSPKLEEPKSKEKGDPERKHKHKKKDKKREESREKHADSKKHKHDKLAKEPPPELKEAARSDRDTPVLGEKECPVKEEPGSPIMIDTSSQSSSKSSKASKLHGLDDISATSDSDSDSGPDDDDSKYKGKPPSRPPEAPKPEVKEEPLAPPPPAPQPEPERPEETAGPSHKDKWKKHKEKRSDGEEKKRRKRKSTGGSPEPESKVKTEGAVKREGSAAGGSRSSKSDTKLQDNGVSSSLGEEGEETSGAETEAVRRDVPPDTGDLSPDYMLRLKDLQQRIMTIKSNEELERVVNLIAETGRYEVTTQTFDFDLCLLDRSTVQQLIALIG